MARDRLRSAWRKRLAMMLRRFKRLRGRWPDKDTISAAKRGIERAIAVRLKVPVEH